MILHNTIKQASKFLKDSRIITHSLDAEIILSPPSGRDPDIGNTFNQG